MEVVYNITDIDTATPTATQEVKGTLKAPKVKVIALPTYTEEMLATALRLTSRAMGKTAGTGPLRIIKH